MEQKDFYTLYKDSDNKFYVKNSITNKEEQIEPLFNPEYWDCPEAFKMAGIKGYEPMTAKELETEEVQDEKLNSSDYLIEEKFDGTRALVYFLAQQQMDLKTNTLSEEKVGFCRVFSRRISKKTGFYVENTDSVPHIREINIPELEGTILDGEMFIDNLPFKEVSSTLNCLWDKAVNRQIELGFITLHAFDILFYKGIDLRKMPLERRKVYLHLAIEEANSPFIKEVTSLSCGKNISVKVIEEEKPNIFNVYKDFVQCGKEGLYPHFCKEMKDNPSEISPKAYYEFIVATGGEGVIIKPKKGLYKHKRGWEYSKIKKFLTREMILIKFDEPTKEYTGKAPKNWGYIEDGIPVTKFYFNKQVGNMILGILISKQELESIPEKKRGSFHKVEDVCKDLREPFNKDYVIMEVCECAGFSDEDRAYFTRNRSAMTGQVIEVKANEIMKDTGRLRHPRYLRMRKDKEPERCLWKDHIL